MFSEYVLEVVTSAVVSASLTGLLLWLAKSWISERLKNAIKTEYDQKLETHKAQLKALADIEIEKLKSNLSIVAAERQIKFSKLHDARAEIIAEIYSLLKEVHITLKDYTKKREHIGDKPRDDRRQIVVDAHRAFRRYYPKKIIYIPIDTAEDLISIDTKFVELFHDFKRTFKHTVDLPQDVFNNSPWNDRFENMQKDLNAALEKLEVNFRNLLGDES